MCSQKSETPLALNSRSKNGVSLDPLSLVPKITYQPEDVVKSNPYDFKDEMYLVALEKQKLEEERLKKLEVDQVVSQHHKDHQRFYQIGSSHGPNSGKSTPEGPALLPTNTEEAKVTPSGPTNEIKKEEPHQTPIAPPKTESGSANSTLQKQETKLK